MRGIENAMTHIRCPWVPLNKPFYVTYHDEEWGVPVHDDRQHFEMLILEGAQAGLSWETILKKRDGYRAAFHNFDVEQVAVMSDAALEALRENPAIVRNRLKIYAARKNAIVFRALQKEYGSFDTYIWSFVNGTPIISTLRTMSDYPARTELSDRISKDLKKRGMTFVGSTIIYAYLQAIGMVNDHTVDCFRRDSCTP